MTEANAKRAAEADRKHTKKTGPSDMVKSSKVGVAIGKPIEGPNPPHPASATVSLEKGRPDPKPTTGFDTQSVSQPATWKKTTPPQGQHGQWKQATGTDPQDAAPKLAQTGVDTTGEWPKTATPQPHQGSWKQGRGSASATGSRSEAQKIQTPEGDVPKTAQIANPQEQKATLQNQPASQKKAQPVVNVKPPAQPAAMRQRHWGLLLSFLILVLIPLGAISYYLYTQAEDQFASTTGFTVRSEEGGAASEFLGGLAQFAGTGTGAESDILYQFIQSQEIVSAVDAEIDIREHYSSYWPSDWVFSIWPDATLEDLVSYWQRIVRISYDQSTGLIEVRVQAFDALTAQRMAQAIVRESLEMINALSNQAREDAMRYARADLEEAVETLKTAREALTQFRTRTQIVDPEADIQGRMGVMNNLQQALATSLIEYDLLRDTASASDPRVINAQRRIDVIRERIAAERNTFTADSTELGAVGEDYPSLIAEFESLSVDRQFAEESYGAALTALDIARDNAARQSRYLATYIQPTLAETPEFPRRELLLGLSALFLTLIWGVLTLIYYSIRDRG